MKTKIADNLIDRVKHLPPAPTVATRLLGLFNDPQRDIDQIVEVISFDPALTAETLNRCNSSYFSGAEPVTEMFDAVFRLGFYQIYCLVMAAVGARAAAIGRNRGGIDVSKLWQHSVTTAVAAGNLAPRVQVSEPVVFSAGLLHDVGKLVFSATETELYTDLQRKSGDSGPSLATAEELILGVNHATLGARLLARWGFPKSICAIIEFHHEKPPDTGPFQRKAAVIQVANYVAHQITAGPANQEAATPCHPDAMSLLRLKEANIPDVIAQTQESLQRVQGLLALVN